MFDSRYTDRTDGGQISFPDEDEFRRMGYAFIDLMVEYLHGLEGRRVYGPVSPAGLDGLFDEEMPEEGEPFDDLVQQCRSKVFPNSMAIGSRRYFGMMNPAPMPVAIFADALCAAMNQNAASWRHAPAATAIEKRVIRWLCTLFGLGPDSFGTLMPGGSIANITGLKLAINRKLGRSMARFDGSEDPVGPDLSRLTFYVSAQAHYSFDKAADLLGMGLGQLRKIPEDDLYRVDLERLEDAIRADAEAGLEPCCVIGIAGTTNTGSVDKLDRLAAIAERHGCWFHVDAAYGGAVMLTDKYRHMLRGIELADSITVDPHKWFYVPFEAGGILVRNGDLLRHSFLVRPEYYMEQARRSENGLPDVYEDRRGFHKGDKVNFFQYGIQGSRRFNALKFWLTMKAIGRRRYAEWVEKDIELARSLAGLLRRDPAFELIGPNTLGICTFRWIPPASADGEAHSEEEIDQLNRDLQQTVERNGDAWFSHTILKGKVGLRVNVENRNMEISDVERLYKVLRRAAAAIVQDREQRRGVRGKRKGSR